MKTRIVKIIRVSEIQIFPIKPKNGLVAFASCIVDDYLYVGGIGIHTSFSNPDGYRLVYPEKILPNGKVVNVVYPICREAGEKISKSIIDKLREITRIKNGNT